MASGYAPALASGLLSGATAAAARSAIDASLPVGPAPQEHNLLLSGSSGEAVTLGTSVRGRSGQKVQLELMSGVVANTIYTIRASNQDLTGDVNGTPFAITVDTGVYSVDTLADALTAAFTAAGAPMSSITVTYNQAKHRFSFANASAGNLELDFQLAATTMGRVLGANDEQEVIATATSGVLPHPPQLSEDYVIVQVDADGVDHSLATHTNNSTARKGFLLQVAAGSSYDATKVSNSTTIMQRRQYIEMAAEGFTDYTLRLYRGSDMTEVTEHVQVTLELAFNHHA